VEDKDLATFKRLGDRIERAWPGFQDLRRQHLRQGERFGKTPEKVAEEIVFDLLTSVLDWAVADINNQVERADLLVTRLGIKHLVVETKRPGALSYGSATFKAALAQAHGYANEQRVSCVAVSDGHLFYAEDRTAAEPRPRTYVELDSEPDVASLWWLSLQGIYRPRPDSERPLCQPKALTRTDADVTGVESGPTGESGPSLLHPKYHLPADCFGYVGDPSDARTWHLPYLHADGSIDASRLPKAIQALLTNYRGAMAGSVPEEAVPRVLQRLAEAARQGGKMPDQCANPAMAYQRLADTLAQLGLAP